MMEKLKVTVNGKDHSVEIEETENGTLKLYFEGESYEVATKDDAASVIDEQLHEASQGSADSTVKAPMPGKIIAVAAKKGDIVKEGALLLKLVAMKMENEIVSPMAGKVREVRVKINDSVNKDDVLVVLE